MSNRSELDDLGETVTRVVATIRTLRAERDRLREALYEIAEGEYVDPRDARGMARAALEPDDA